jgi:broad specificity polyphosphatase/5'/3'-nucleotidase SurE
MPPRSPPIWCATSSARGPGAIEPGTLLNVNLPAGPVRGLRPTSLGHRIYRDQVSVRQDLRGRELLLDRRSGGKGSRHSRLGLHRHREGLVSVTAIGLDLTHRPMLDRLARGGQGAIDSVAEGTGHPLRFHR